MSRITLHPFFNYANLGLSGFNHVPYRNYENARWPKVGPL